MVKGTEKQKKLFENLCKERGLDAEKILKKAERAGVDFYGDLIELIINTKKTADPQKIEMWLNAQLLDIYLNKKSREYEKEGKKSLAYRVRPLVIPVMLDDETLEWVFEQVQKAETLVNENEKEKAFEILKEMETTLMKVQNELAEKLSSSKPQPQKETRKLKP